MNAQKRTIFQEGAKKKWKIWTHQLLEKKAELATKNSQQTSPGPDGVTGGSTHLWRGGNTHRTPLLQKTEKEGTIVNSAHEASTTLKPKPKTVINKRTPGQRLRWTWVRHPQQHVSKQHARYRTRVISPNEVGLILGTHACPSTRQCDAYSNGTRAENVLSTDTGEALNKNQRPLMIKTLNKAVTGEHTSA